MDQAAVIGRKRRRTAASAAVRRRVLWLVAGTAVVVGATMLIMQAAGFIGWDAPAHLYKIALLRQGGSILWDNSWYGGAYQLVNYGFVFYWLAQFIDLDVIVVVSAAVLPALFFLYMRRVYRVTSALPSVVLAGVLAVYLANGQDPFLFALALTFGGLVLQVYDRRLPAALLIGAAAFANPVGVMVGVIFLVAQYLAFPERRAGLRRLALYLLPFIVVRIALQLIFWEAAAYFYRPIEVFVYVIFGVGGALVARTSIDPERRPKEILFLTFVGVALVAALLPANGMGGTFGRFFFVFGLPLFVSLRRLTLPRWFAVALLVGVAVGQLIVPVTHYLSGAQGVSTRPGFFAPALAFAASHDDPNYRFHVVALSNHWEAYYFSVDGFPITRGWYRQSDALHNELLYRRQFTAGQYAGWLRHMGVKYVFLPHATLDLSGCQERAILVTSPSFRLVDENRQWSVYELRRPRSLAQPLHAHGTADVIALGRESMTIEVDRPGPYLVKVSYSPYWALTAGRGRLTPGPGDFLLLHARSAGLYTVHIQVTPASLWGQLVARL